ncbi:STB3 like [Lecanosticta acicola]|uniref:STB3 like n=1 Tax=Lecanosticta acicola TaxID=111012 RepID=A0AAI9E8M9_9PEZI|nr:STB3 like [Lecanosticta acicola]
MAHASNIAMALASQTSSVAIPKARDFGDASGTANYEKAASALLTPPESSSISPELPACPDLDVAFSPPPITIEQDMDMQEADDTVDYDLPKGGMPLSRGALSDLDGSATITPSMLAKHHLPGIMLGNGPRPIRYVMGELTHTVPGFSRIPPAKARRIVVAALESRDGGGPDGNVEFCKTGWGRWDAHYKGSSRDSGIGSFHEGHLSPPRSERSSYAMSHGDSAVHIPAPPVPGKYRDQYSGTSWTNSSIREEYEFGMDMDPVEEEADKMSMDGDSDDSSQMDDDTDDDDWAAQGVEALRKASLSTSTAPRQSYQAVSIPYNGPWASKSWTRRPSTNMRSLHSSSVPTGRGGDLNPALQTPEENAAAALLSLGSM